MNKPSNKIPVLFQTLKDFNAEDIRFTKVKIWLMHLEENMNGSYFSREAVEKAIPSLANTPIMGLVNEEDFEGHEREMEVSDDEITFKNITVPYGVIPEFNNAHFEDRVGDDGVTRTYLTVEGLLWNKWEDAINVLNSKGGVTGQSMELANEYTGQFDDEGLFHFNEFKFDGACLLGDDVQPAMNDSTVEISFSDKVGKIIQEKLEVYSRSINEGGNEVSVNKVKEDEEFAKKASEEPKATDEDIKEEPKTEEPAPVEEPKDEPKVTEPAEEPVEPAEEPVEDPEDEEPVIKEDTLEEARKATQEDEKSKVPEIERIVVSGTSYSVEEATKLIEAHFALLKELHEEKVDALFETHADNLTEDEISELRKDASTKAISDIENAIFATIGRKNFSTKSNTKVTTPSVDYASVVTIDNKDTSNEPYGGVLQKYL